MTEIKPVRVTEEGGRPLRRRGAVRQTPGADGAVITVPGESGLTVGPAGGRRSGEA